MFKLTLLSLVLCLFKDNKFRVIKISATILVRDICIPQNKEAFKKEHSKAILKQIDSGQAADD